MKYFNQSLKFFEQETLVKSKPKKYCHSVSRQEILLWWNGGRVLPLRLLQSIFHLYLIHYQFCIICTIKFTFRSIILFPQCKNGFGFASKGGYGHKGSGGCGDHWPRILSWKDPDTNLVFVSVQFFVDISEPDMACFHGVLYYCDELSIGWLKLSYAKWK